MNIQSNTVMTDTQVEIARICDDVKELLLYKNKNYGDSALNPCRIFSQANEVEQLLVRIDDKLNRIKKGVGLLSTDEDVLMDLIGYLVLLKIGINKQQKILKPVKVRNSTTSLPSCSTKPS